MLFALPSLLFLLFGALFPLIRLLYEGGVHISSGLLSDAYLQWRISWTLLQAALTCLFTTMLGIPIAYVLARFDFVGRRLILQSIMLPFVTPTLVAATGVLALFGAQGISGWKLQDTPWLLLYGNIFFNLPLVIRLCAEGFSRLSPTSIAAARSLGASAWRTFWQIEWPMILPWLLASLCLVFLFCFSGFGMALLLGGQRYATIEVDIYSLVAYEMNLPDAGALALLALIIMACVTTLYAILQKRLATKRPVERTLIIPPQNRYHYAFILSTLIALAIFIAAPLVAIFYKSLCAYSSWYTLINEETLAALWNTLRFTFYTLCLSAFLGITHALAAQHYAWLRTTIFIPFIISPICLAFGLLLLYPGWIASPIMLIGAYTLLAYPFVSNAVLTQLDSLPAHYTQVARSLGASTWRTGYVIVWPLLRPACRRGLALAATTALGEFSITLFLSRPEWMTLSTLIYQVLGRPGQQNQEQALSLSCLLMLLALFVFILIERPALAVKNKSC